MSDVKAPTFPESVADGTVAVWNKAEGDAVELDEVIAEIETDKVVLEVVAPSAGVMGKILKAEGEVVESEELLATIEAGGESNEKSDEQPKEPEESSEEQAEQNADDEPADDESSASSESEVTKASGSNAGAGLSAGPAARKAARDQDKNLDEVTGSGVKGRVTKQDVSDHAADSKKAADKGESDDLDSDLTEDTSMKTEDGTVLSQAVGERVEKRVPMTRLRKRVAERLLSATQETAMLTTFNEVNMQPIMDMRKDYQARFEDRHNVRLGFMSFFVKACTEALKRFPAVNASLDKEDVVYHGYYDIGVAVSTERGLMVPVLRDTDRMNLAEVEKQIIKFGNKAKDGKLGLDDITGGTFTISNGGVFGSLLSTPILNPPQTAILGMHTIQKRPIALDGEVVIRPMMYLALSYDHRMIDGKEAVQFLVTIKELVEDPALLLLDL